MEKKQRLESMLSVVQDLKREKYIGTQRAFNIIKRITRLNTNPERIASEINDKLANQGLEGFLATPERLYGIGGALNDLTLEFGDELITIRDSYVEDQENDFFYNLCLKDSRNLADEFLLLESVVKQIDFQEGSYLDWIFGEKTESIEYQDKLMIYMQDLFSEANICGMNTDQKFGLFLSVRLFNELSDISIPFDIEWGIENAEEMGLDIEPDESVINNFPLAVYTSMQTFDWREIFSHARFNKAREKYKQYMHTNCLGVIIEGVINDRVDHRLEYRRQILATYLSRFGSELITYEQLIEDVDRKLEERKSRHSRSVGLSAPMMILSNDARLLKEIQLIRNLVASDKNWLTRYLRS